MSKIRKKKLLKEIKKEEEKKLEAQKCIKKLPGETILQYLRRIIKLIKWYTLVTILIALPGSVWTGIQLYNYIFKDELKEEKELIAQQISVLENDLKPQSLPIEIDTLQDVKLIKKFQKVIVLYLFMRRKIKDM